MSVPLIWRRYQSRINSNLPSNKGKKQSTWKVPSKCSTAKIVHSVRLLDQTMCSDKSSVFTSKIFRAHHHFRVMMLTVRAPLVLCLVFKRHQHVNITRPPSVEVKSRSQSSFASRNQCRRCTVNVCVCVSFTSPTD